MKKDLSKTHILAPELKDFAVVLNKWREVCRKYSARVQDDRPWHYHERAQIGFLAAAVWAAGGIALEEWRTEKWAPNGDCSPGRGDLWLEYGLKRRKLLRLHLEAKHVQVTLKADLELARKKLEKHLLAAQDAASKIRCDQSEQCFAVVFAVAVMPRGAESTARERFEAWRRSLLAINPKPLALATIYDPPNTKERLLPGMAMLIVKASR